MKTLKLFEEFKRLLEYSGKEVTEISLTKDGAVATVNFEGEAYTIFMSKKTPAVYKIDDPAMSLTGTDPY